MWSLPVISDHQSKAGWFFKELSEQFKLQKDKFSKVKSDDLKYFNEMIRLEKLPVIISK
jgi:DNA segregation ATPase FtsK/SpoIIIE-like protein